MTNDQRNLIRLLIGLWWVGLCLGLASASSMAADALVEFETDAQAALYLQLTKDHRCLKCQNQNLADSNAGIAQDLKREIYQRVVQGESGPDISDYLVARYGDFVLYRPPFKASTYALWIGPFVLLFVALWYAMRFSKQSNRERQAPDSNALATARELLDNPDKK